MGSVARGYIRVSTKGQEESGVGAEAQTRSVMDTFERVAKPLGFEWGGLFSDLAVSRSRGFADRKGGREICLLSRRGDAVILPKIDRGFGNVRDTLNQFHQWEVSGVRVFSPDLAGSSFDSQSIMGRFALMMLAFFAEWEYHTACQRNRGRVAALRAAGRPVGEAPFGLSIYQAGKRKHFRPNPQERAMMAMCLLWHEQGYSYKTIAEHLAAVGQRSRAGGTYGPPKVQRMIELERLYRELEEGLPPGHFVTPDGVVLALPKEEQRRKDQKNLTP